MFAGTAKSVSACVLVILFVPCVLQGGIPEHQAQLIREAAPEKPRTPPKKPRRVLIWNTPLINESPHKGYCIPYGTYAMRILGEKTGAFEPVVSDDVRVLLPESIRQFDAIVMNNSDGPWIRPAEDVTGKLDRDSLERLLRKSLLDYVAQGGGIVAYHYAIGGNRHWPEFQELLGAGYWGHPWHEEVGIRLEEPDHPLLAAFQGKDFRLTEEIFQFREPYSRAKLRVLLSLDTAATNMTVEHIYRKDNDFALAWLRSYGLGRVFYCAFGHRTEIYWNPTILSFYLDAIQFAAGDLEAPVEPRPRKLTATLVRQRRLEGKGRADQGIALTPEVYYSANAGSICRFDTGWNLVGEKPIRLDGVNHLGAIDHHDGFIWAGFLNGPENGKYDPEQNRAIVAKIRADDLEVVQTWDLTHEVKWIDPVCFDGTHLWVGDLSDLGIHRYRLVDRQLKRDGILRHPSAMGFSQGIRVRDKYLYSIHTFGSMDGLSEFEIPETLSDEVVWPVRVWSIQETRTHLEGFDFVPGVTDRIWHAQGDQVDEYTLEDARVVVTSATTLPTSRPR